MPKKTARAKPPVDDATGALAPSPHEKAAAKKTAARDSGAAGVAGENAAAFRAAARFIRGGQGADGRDAQGPERRGREQARIAEWALAQGQLIQDGDLEPLPRSYFGWMRAADGVVVLDARADNFVLAAEGVIPQLARVISAPIS